MAKEDLILEALKNSIEAGAKEIELFIDGNTFTVIDDGNLSFIPTLGAVCSSKGESRGRGLYLLYNECHGNISLGRDGEKTVFKAVFTSSIIKEEIVPAAFNLFPFLVFHSMKNKAEIYRLDYSDIREMGLDPEIAGNLARLKKIIREKELRS